MTDNEIQVPNREEVLNTLQNATRTVDGWPEWKKSFILDEPETSNQCIEEPER